MLVQLAIVSWLAIAVHGFGAGPPTAQCTTMDPVGHNGNNAGSTNPFSVVVNATSYNPNDVISVTVTLPGSTFKGFMIQMRPYTCAQNSTTQMGTWSLPAGVTDFAPIACNSVAASAVGHANNNTKMAAMLYWTAPSTASGHGHIVGTLVQSRNMYWMKQSLVVVNDASMAALNCNTGSTVRSSVGIVFLSVVIKCLQLLNN